MRSKTWPFPEGVPEKYEGIESDSIANSEWCRICDELAARRMLSPAWGGMICIAASTFSSIKRTAAVIEVHGRTEEFAESHAASVAGYLAACRELTVEPHPSVRRKKVKRGQS